MDNNIESCVPPGFRFHPTEEELVNYYLKRKINTLDFDLDIIIDLDLYKIEPGDIQDKCKLGYSEQNEWYFFSHKDRKYPTGSQTNRATGAGFWKATGRDKAVLSKKKSMIGMRKTLVYYNGRAPNGRRSDWIMHEYRLQTTEHGRTQEEGWVVCRAFKKPSPTHKQHSDAWNHHHHHYKNYITNNRIHSNIIEQENMSNQLIDLPRLHSPTRSSSFATKETLFEHDSGKWENMDNFFSSKVLEVPEMPRDFDFEAQNQLNSFFACFPNL